MKASAGRLYRQHHPRRDAQPSGDGAQNSITFDVLAVGGLLTLAFGGYVKGSHYLQALPVDITAAAIGVTALTLCACILRKRYVLPPNSLLLLALYMAFVSGWPAGPWSSYTSSKVAGVFVLIPLCVLGGSYLLARERARRWWTYGNVLMGFLILVLVKIEPTLDSAGNQITEGGTRITVSRAAGAGFVVLLIMAVTSSKRRLAYLAGAVVLASTMLGAGSRGPLLSAVASIFLVAAIAPQRGRLLRAVFLGAGLGSFGWFLYTSGQVATRLTTFTDDVSAQARTILWHRAWVLMESHPLGFGWGRLYENMPANEVLTAAGGKQYPHNMFLEVGSEAGWLALALFLAVLAISFRIQLRRSGTAVESAMLALFVFYLLNAMVSSDITENRGVWVAVGACLAASLSKSAAGPGPGIRGTRRRGLESARVSGRDV